MKYFKIYLILTFMLSACTSQHNLVPTYNNGGYKFLKITSKTLIKQDSILISGQVFDLSNHNQIINSSLQLGCLKVNTIDGYYSLKTKPFKNKHQILSSSVGYLKIETEPFKTVAGDSIIINFYMEEDKRPLINCEGD